MNKYIKYALYGVGGIVALALLIAAYFAATFNPNDYKDDIIKLVKDKKERTLNIEGDIKLSFWPKIGANLGKLSISEHKSDTEFASVNSVKVALAVLPLLKKQLVVDTIYVDGAKANIIKYKDGTTNFDDLLSKDDTESETIKFDIDGVNVINSAVNYSDEASGAKYSVSQFNMQSGHIALAEPIDLQTDFVLTANQPAIAANVTLKGNFLADPETKHFQVKGLDSHITGEMFGGTDLDIKATGNVDAKTEQLEFLVDGLQLVASGKFDGSMQTVDLSAPAISILKDEVNSKKVTISFNQEKADGNLKANMVLADMKGSPKALQSSGITGDLSMVQGKRTVTGTFSSPFSGNIDNLIFDIPKLVGKLDVKDPSLPNGSMSGSFNLGAHADIKKELVNSQFDLNIAETKLAGDIDVASFKTPNIKFNLNADKLDLNKLLPKSNETKASTPTKSSNKPTDLSALKNLLLDGKLNIGSIIYEKYRVSGLNVAIKADGEKLSLSGLNVKVDNSQIKGSLAISQFAKPLYTFNLDIDQVDVDQYVTADSGKNAPSTSKPASDKPLDLSALKALNANGSIRVGSLKYGKTKASNININLKADGEKLSLNPLSAKVDDSQINANLGISQFSNPAFNFAINIDQLDADRYITKTEPSAKTETTAKNSADTPIDLSALKKLNASGEAKIGKLKLANVKTQNVNIGLKANGGIATLSPFSANLYQGSMSGLLKVDARATPIITFQQNMKNIAIGPLMVDAINNDMLSGTGGVNVDVTTQGASVNGLKKALAGNAALNLANGAVKGVDIAGSIRDIKSKVDFLKTKETNADKSKKTDFSELTATFTIKNGVAHNEDLAMKAPVLRLAKGDSRGDIDIGNETINYLAKPTIVKSLKGQGGADLDELSGIGIPVKITGTFASPKYGMDFAAIATALAQSKLLDKVGGEKGAAVKELINGGDKAKALEGLLNKKKPADSAAGSEATPAQPAEEPKSLKEQAKEKALKKLLNF
ncbi:MULTISPECIES: AsmA family protein [Methylotenera]|uniref:AsmA family protein n=1 Tax=Methylotenera TaxID=359407 RepID=UPI0003816B8D|nr:MULTISPECIES: AsmA family protein [Methylotenera]